MRPDHYLLDGASLPLARESVTVAFKDGEAVSSETRDFWSTPLGPVIHRTADQIFIARTAGDGEFRAGEQFLRMMRATSFAEWKEAMQIRALVTSNYTYADRAGNIFSYGTRRCPHLPHPPGGDARDAGARDARPVDALRSIRSVAAVLEPARRLRAQRERLAALRQRARPRRTRERLPEHRAADRCGCAASTRLSSSAATGR